MSSVRSDDGQGLMQGKFSHRAARCDQRTTELKIQTETPAVSHEETPPLPCGDRPLRCGGADLFDKHLASTIPCVDDEVIGSLQRREQRRRARAVMPPSNPGGD